MASRKAENAPPADTEIISEIISEVVDSNSRPPAVFLNIAGHKNLTTEELDDIRSRGVSTVMGEVFRSSDVFETLPIWPKELFIGRPFTLIEWRFNDGEFDSTFVSLTVLDEHNRIGIVNDGGKGVHDQLARLTDKTGRQRGPIFIETGLSKSAYFVDDQNNVYKVKPDGIKTIPAATFYLS